MFALAFLFYLRGRCSCSRPRSFGAERFSSFFAAIAGPAFLLRRDERRRDGIVFVWWVVRFAGCFSRKTMILPFPERPAHLDPDTGSPRRFHVTKDFCLPRAVVAEPAGDLRDFRGAGDLVAPGAAFCPPVLLGTFLVLATVTVVANNDPQLDRLAGMMSPVGAAFTAVAWDRTGRAVQAA